MFKKIFTFVIAAAFIVATASPTMACHKRWKRAHAQAYSPGVYTREVPKNLDLNPKGMTYGYGGGHWRGRGGGGWGPRYGPRYGPGPDLGTAVVGGIIGGAVVNWWNRPAEPPPPPPPPPEPPPPPQGASAVVLDPFTGPWYEWCAGKYKSFDAKTGTWTDNDGQKHFCGQ